MSISNFFTKQKSDRFAIWRIIYLLTGGLMIFGVLLTTYFVYQNIYTTIANTEAIGILQASASVDSLDIKDYDNIRALLENRSKAQPISKDLRNIFIPYVAPTTTLKNVTTTPSNKK